MAAGGSPIPGRAGVGPGPGTPGPLLLPRARARRSLRWITGVGTARTGRPLISRSSLPVMAP
eukprot:11361579-Alexandrium_andersonii.AAC.1